MVVRHQIVELLLGYGRFNEAAASLTADTLLLLLIGLTAHSAIAVLARAFYARNDTRTPTVAAVLAVAINCTLAIALVGTLGLPAIGLAIAIAAWAEALALLVWLRRREPTFDVGGLAWVVLRCLIAAVACALVASLALNILTGGAPVGIGTGTGGRGRTLGGRARRRAGSRMPRPAWRERGTGSQATGSTSSLPTRKSQHWAMASGSGHSDSTQSRRSSPLGIGCRSGSGAPPLKSRRSRTSPNQPGSASGRPSA